MFEALQDKLSNVFRKLGGRGRLTETQIDEAMREVRVALLEADVNFQVARSFVAKVKERALEPAILDDLNPAQQVINIVQEELVATLGGAHRKLNAASQAPTVVMLAGLQGSGKTTTAAKLALHLKRQGNKPLLVAADVKRPAAVQQLVTLGKQIDVAVYEEGSAPTGTEVCLRAIPHAREIGASWVILDTAGRLHIDEEMMTELSDIARELSPTETLLVVDSMTGQDAVTAAQEFHERVELTGLVLTKMDGDARGGAALSISSVTGVPIKFMGMGEKTDALEPYHPDRLASRILGMGDLATLTEKAQEVIDVGKAQDFERKLRTASFNLEDFLDQLRQVKQMGSLSSVLEMIPGMSTLTKRLPNASVDDGQLVLAECIVLSMTPRERQHPEIIGGSRRKRIANGSGTTPADVNRLLNQFDQVRKMMKRMSSGKGKRVPGLPGMFR